MPQNRGFAVSFLLYRDVFSLDVENVVALDGILSTCVEAHVHAMVMVIMNFYWLYRRAKKFKSGLITNTMI